MKILYFGGQKSGKSFLAEQKSLSLADSKPYYIATYDNSYGDNEMQQRIKSHQNQRKNNFISIEEPFDLTSVIKKGETYLVDCLSMWILNNLKSDINKLKSQIQKISNIDSNIVFVLNDTNNGIIPLDSQTRKYVDYTGILGQELVKYCDEVYEVKFGIEKRLK